MFDIRSYVSDRPGKTEVGSVRIPYFFKNDITKYKQNRVIIEKKMNDIIEQMGILDISDEIYNSLIDSFDETSTILKQNKEYAMDKIYDFRDTGYKLIDEYHADEIPEYKSELDTDIDKVITEVAEWNTEFNKPPHSTIFI